MGQLGVQGDELYPWAGSVARGPFPHGGWGRVGEGGVPPPMLSYPKPAGQHQVTSQDILGPPDARLQMPPLLLYQGPGSFPSLEILRPLERWEE